MPDRRAPWQFIPTDVLDLQTRTDEASAWAQEQRRQLAQQWADLHLQDAYDSLGHLLYQSPATQEPPSSPVMPSTPPDLGMPPAQDMASQTSPDAMSIGSEGDRPASEFQPPSQPDPFARRLGPDTVAPTALSRIGIDVPVPGPSEVRSAALTGANAVGQGIDWAGDTLWNQITGFGTDQQEFQDLSRAQFEAARQGQSLPPEQDQRLADLSSQYGLALTGEPLANAGGGGIGPALVAHLRSAGLTEDAARLLMEQVAAYPEMPPALYARVERLTAGLPEEAANAVWAGLDRYRLERRFGADVGRGGAQPTVPATESSPLSQPPVTPPERLPAGSLEAQRPRPLPPLTDNYRKPLSEYADTVYHETGADRVERFLPTAGGFSSDASLDHTYLATSPDLALGQGGNKGVLLEFDAGGIQGQVNTKKPAWEPLWDQGDAEFIGRLNEDRVYRESLRSVTVKPEVAGSKGDRMRLRRTLAGLEDEGWTRATNPDGSVTYTRPAGTPPTPEAPTARTVEPPIETPRPPMTAESAPAEASPIESGAATVPPLAESSSPAPAPANTGTGAPGPAAGVGAAAIDKTNAMFAEGASHAAQPIKARLGALGTSLTRMTTDAGVDLSNLERDAERTLGRQLTAKESASIQARLNPFYTARIQVDDALRPVLSGASDAEYEAARNALTWRGNVDVATAKGNPDRAFSGGLSAAESQAALSEQARRVGPEQAAAVDQRVQAVVDFNKAELERDVAAGLVSREQADTWLQQYPNYTPVVISDYLREQGRAIGSGKSLNVQGTGYKTLTSEGTARARIDPIAATVDAAYQGEALRRQNIAWRALHDMIQSTPEMANLFQIQKGGYSGATKYENSVSGFIDGERYTITTPFPEIARAIRQEAGGVNIPGWNTAMALYKELITGRNPTFLVGNAAIDAPIAILNTAIREGGAQHILPIAVDLFKGYADAFKGIMSGQYTGNATSAYLKGGGGMGFYAAPSATSGAKEVARLRRSSVIDVSSAGDLARLAKDLVSLEWVKGLGERVELGPRAMAYQRALKQGASPEQAVLNGRTVTVDFAQGGTLAKLVNSFVPFFNPAVQGLAQGAKIVKDNPRGALMTLGPALLGPATAVEAWNRADPARSKAYDDVPDYIKDRGIVIMLPGTPPTDANGEPKPQYVVLNMRQYAPLVMAVRQTYDRVTGRDGRTAGDLLQGAAQQLSPVSSFGQMLPPGITTGAELAANRDLYRRTDIATNRNDERASALAGAAATGINAVLGTRVRPSQADYAIRDLTGGVGDMASSASNILAGKTKESGTPQDIPVLGGFARRLVRGDTGQLLQNARDTRVSPDVQRALVEAGLPPEVGVAPSTYRSIPLLQGEQTVYQQETNKHLEELLGPIVRDPSFKTLPLDAKTKLVQRMVTAAEQMAGAAVIQAIPPGQVNERMGRVIAKKAS